MKNYRPSMKECIDYGTHRCSVDVHNAAEEMLEYLAQIQPKTHEDMNLIRQISTILLSMRIPDAV